MPSAVYIHIPFCEQICHYCDFNKLLIDRQPVDEYLTYLDKEIRNTLEKYPPSNIETIYIGGGTPTALTEQQLVKLLEIVGKHFNTSNRQLEFTVEANPAVTDQAKLAVLKKFGVNRLSIGVQAFQDNLLLSLNRNHQEKDIQKMVRLARDTGFTNISIDLMFGLPGQTITNFRESIEKAVALQPEHISAYSLQVEPKTVFYIRQRKGQLQKPTQEAEADMFQLLIEETAAHGYEHYEISNFAKPGFESKHNLTYWNNEEYYGFGAGAHSYLSGHRIGNAGPLKKYMNLIDETKVPHFSISELSSSEQMEEELFLGLRKRTGVSKKIFLQKYNVEIDKVFGEQIKRLLQRGWIEEEHDVIRLTHQGIFFGNEVFQEFIGVI